MKIAFLELLKAEDLKTPLKNAKIMKTMSFAGSPRQNTPIYFKTEPSGMGADLMFENQVRGSLCLMVCAL